MAAHEFSGALSTDGAHPAPRGCARGRLLSFAGRVFVTVLLCTAAGVSAQTVFKSVDAAGKVRYSDREAAPRPAPAAFVTASHVASALERNVAMSSPGAVTIDAREAARSLGQARLDRARGARPLAAELAFPGQHDLVTYRYWRRQEQLRQATELALRRSNETRLRMRAHRAPHAVPTVLACVADPCAGAPIASIAVKYQP